MSPYVLLINPWVHDFTAFDLWAKPLGLLYIASTLRHFGYRVHLIDCLQYGTSFPQAEACGYQRRPYGTGAFYSQVIEKPSVFKNIPRRFKRYGMPPEKFLSKLKRLVGAGLPRPYMVCVTSHMTYWYPGVFEAIKMVKSVFPSVPVALGGIYASLCYEHARANSGADYVMKGPGEMEVLRLADKLCGKERDYSQTIIYAVTSEGATTHASSPLRGEGREGVNITLPLPPPLKGGGILSEGPLPAYDLYPALRSASLLTSRGCPFRCTYCASFLLGPRFLRRSPERVVAEIGYYVNALGVKDIAFYDDALLVDPERHIVPILELLIKKGLKARFHTPNGLHPRYIDLSLARLLWEAGFRTLRLGFEGTSARVQGASGHKVNNQELERVLGYLWQAGYSARDVGVYLLIGLPGQTVKEVVVAMEWVNGLGARVKLAEYSPIPGTEEFQRASVLYPQVAYEPLSHNKSVFAPVGMGIDYETFEGLKSMARRLNDELGIGGTLQRAPTVTMES